MDSVPRRAGRLSTVNGWGLYLLLAAAAIFSFLARFVERFPGDVALIRWVQSWQHPLITTFMQSASVIGKSRFLVGTAAITVLLLFLRGRRRECLAAVGALGILILTPLLQLLVDRSRPPADLVGLSDPLGGLGFPSGHAYQSFVLCGFLIYLAAVLIKRPWPRRCVQVGLAGLIASIGISRVYLGAHWPSDVLGAYLLGGSFLGLLLRAVDYQLPGTPSR